MVTNSNKPQYPTDVFLVSCGMGCKRIKVSDIAYIEAMRDNCIIHMNDGVGHTLSCPMCDIESQLNPSQFMRIHRSFVVNVSYIGTYWYGYGSLNDGKEVNIGDTYREPLKNSLVFWGTRNRMRL